jgi:hypothetical protein
MNTKKLAPIRFSQSPEHCGQAEIYVEWMDTCLRLARNPSWKEWVWGQVKELDSDTSGLFTGFKDEFLTRVKEVKNESISDQ